MRVIICGSRNWDDEYMIGAVLSGLLHVALGDRETLVVIDGKAPGADTIAGAWYGGREDGVHAVNDDVFHERYPVDWPPPGSARWLFAAAGHQRNQRMIDEGHPDLVVAFKDGFDWQLRRGGTEDMVSRAKQAAIPFYVVSRS